MSWSKILAVTAIIIFVSSSAMVDCSVAGDKMKWHGGSINVKWEQIEVGDEEGHVIGLSQNRTIFFNETTGEKSASVSIGLMDINPKTGKIFGHGYGISTFKDGSKTFRSWEGKAVGKGHWQGTWTVIKGTGKYEGATGGGTWDSYSLAPQHSYIEVEGEYKVPGQ